ncbi:MAG: NAD-dependent epimerase/dehydratase family protein [Oligoflexia bacterium]|nr:NAD-dependent epimerase/dehydratase family protein [Oligoflexia bacterium]
MKVLITGGAGFIGSHLALRLLKNGQEVLVIDDLSLGQEKFLKDCFKFKTFQFEKLNLLDYDRLLPLVKGVDRVWHMAANSDIALGGKNTDRDLKMGTLVTYNVLEAMRWSQAREIIFASTSAVYGEASVRPTPETYGPMLPISFYGASKLACEALITAFAHNFQMKAWIYRFANIVGSHTTHGAIHDFIKKLKTNSKELEVLGDGNQEKSYLHVNDCLDGMEFGLSKSNSEVNLFNLSSHGICTVAQIAESVISGMKLKAQIRFTGGTRGWKGDVARVHLDGSRLQKLGFAPKLDSAQAVRAAVSDILGDSELGIS